MGNGEQYIWKPPEENDGAGPGGPSLENGQSHARAAEVGTPTHPQRSAPSALAGRPTQYRTLSQGYWKRRFHTLTFELFRRRPRPDLRPCSACTPPYELLRGEIKWGWMRRSELFQGQESTR